MNSGTEPYPERVDDLMGNRKVSAPWKHKTHVQFTKEKKTIEKLWKTIAASQGRKMILSETGRAKMNR